MADPDDKQSLVGTAETSSVRAQSGILIYLPNRLLLGLCAFQFAVLIVLAWMNWGPALNSGPSPRIVVQARPRPASTNTHETLYRGHPGPWGELEYARINLELPDEFVVDDGRLAGSTRWLFPGYTRTQLRALFDTSDLAPAQRAELLNPSSWEDDSNGIVVVPSEQLVLGLSPSARAQIYSVLAESPLNDFQFWPCVFRNGGIDDWFEESGLSSATLSLVKRLVYQRGSSLCFSDFREVVPKLSSAAERKRLEKTLSRNSSVLMKLRVSPATDVHALMAYWGKAGNAKDVEPLLESLTMAPGSVTIDVVHLLPPFARKRLNTYPVFEPAGHAPDCYWTAMNFFNDPPDPRYSDNAVWREELTRNYSVVPSATYGDLVFLVRPDGVPLHAAVFIADDVVFTKNGANFHQPWMLEKMDDLLARYPETFPVRVVFFRSRSRAG